MKRGLLTAIVLLFGFLLLIARPQFSVGDRSDVYQAKREQMVATQIALFVFSVDSVFQSDLDSNRISEDLWQVFKDNRIPLSRNVTISIEEKDSQWLITDNKMTYAVRKVGARLNIYRDDLFGRIAVKNELALEAMRRVPRHEFVPDNLKPRAYFDTPLPIGYDQTISQPYVVAYMTELIKPQKKHKVLEVGTGSGYQAAVLAELVDHVYTIEIIEALGEPAKAALARLSYENVTVKIGDGYFGWEAHAPYDAILVTAAPDHIPPSLVRQLKPGGIMCIPVGGRFQTQNLTLVQKRTDGSIRTKQVMPVRFVPLTGKH